MNDIPEEILEIVAKAMYDSNEFKKPWDHPKVSPLWRPIYFREACAAIQALEQAGYQVMKKPATQFKA